MMVKKSAAWLVMLALIGFGAVAWAESGLSMSAEKGHPEAEGVLHLSADSIDLHAEGLKPNSVYTVWFVNMKPKKSEAGAGTAPYMFRTDGSGRGHYHSTLNESPFGKWQMVMVVLHPTGDPADMKNMVGALSVKVPDKP